MGGKVLNAEGLQSSLVGNAFIVCLRRLRCKEGAAGSRRDQGQPLVQATIPELQSPGEALHRPPESPTHPGEQCHLRARRPTTETHEHVDDVERWQAGICSSWFDWLVCSRHPRYAFSHGSGRLPPPPLHASAFLLSLSLLRLKMDTWLSLSATWLWLGRICEKISDCYKNYCI